MLDPYRRTIIRVLVISPLKLSSWGIVKLISIVFSVAISVVPSVGGVPIVTLGGIVGAKKEKETN